MSPEEWKSTFLSLLNHFDDIEGTTYLYQSQIRRSFIQDLKVSNEAKAEITEILSKYHSRGVK